jgi:DNA-binding transcriptional LysR family regulator
VGRLGKSLYDNWEFEHKGKGFNVKVSGPLILNDHKYMVDATVDGVGLIYVNEDDIIDKIKTGKLETVLTQFVPDSDGCFLYFPQRSQVQPKLRAFIEHVNALAR